MMLNFRKFLFGPIVVVLVFSIFKLQQHFNLERERTLITNSAGFKIQDVTEESNLGHFHHTLKTHPSYKNVAKWIESMGAGVTVADFNNDGFMDIILNDNQIKYGHSLFINDQHGQFVDKTQEFNLKDSQNVKYQTRLIAFDCNNDGFMDLMISSNCMDVYVNMGGKSFVKHTTESGIYKKCDLPPVLMASAFDYDKDGNLDLIFGGYFSNDPFYDDKHPDGIVPDNFNDSKNSAPIFLMKGDGQCHFKDKSELLPKSIKERGWFLDVGVADIFQDGNQDLWFATDYGITHPMRFISPDKGWSDESDMVDKPTKTRNSMGVSVSDIDHQKINNFFLPNIYHPREKVNGNLLWQYDKNSRTLVEKARDYNAHSCGWAWGSQFLDLNNDTWDDIVVTNGMFGDGSSSKSYWYSLSVLDASGRAFMGDIKNWPDMGKFDLDSNQQDCLFVNLGKGRGFAQVEQATDFDLDKKNGRGVAYIDVNNDGHYSLVVTNQGDNAHIYKVLPNSPFNWIGLTLKTANNNSYSTGAKIFWKLSDGTESMKEMRPIQGYMAQNDPRFRLGYPKNVQLVSMSILWLDGKKQDLDLKSLKMNQYNTVTRGAR